MNSVRRIHVDQNAPHDDWTVVTINEETVYLALRAPWRARIHAIDIHYYGPSDPVYDVVTPEGPAVRPVTVWCATRQHAECAGGFSASAATCQCPCHAPAPPDRERTEHE